MKGEGVEYREGENWLKTFASRRIIIPLDCSRSMRVGSEHWKFDVAVAEVKEIVRYYRNLASSKRVILMPFAGSCEVVMIKHVDEIDERIRAVISMLKEEGGIGEANNWSRTFESVHRALGENPTERNSVFILSDFECNFEVASPTNLLTSRFQEPAKLHLCLIGNSPLASSFIQKVKNFKPIQSAALIGGEPLRKRARPQFEIEIFDKHISSQNGEVMQFSLSRAPTVLDEVFDDPFDQEELDEGEVGPVQQYDSDSDYNDEYYLDMNSSNSSSDY